MWSIYYALGWKWTLLCGLATAYMWQLKAPVYLLESSTFQPPKDWQVSHQDILRIMREINPDFTEVCWRRRAISDAVLPSPGV